MRVRCREDGLTPRPWGLRTGLDSATRLQSRVSLTATNARSLDKTQRHEWHGKFGRGVRVGNGDYSKSSLLIRNNAVEQEKSHAKSTKGAKGTRNLGLYRSSP